MVHTHTHTHLPKLIFTNADVERTGRATTTTIKFEKMRMYISVYIGSQETLKVSAYKTYLMLFGYKPTAIKYMPPQLRLICAQGRDYLYIFIYIYI